MKRAVVVICDGLRADMVHQGTTPNLWALAAQGLSFTNHRSVFPATTRTTSASIATGCLPGRHGLDGNCMAIDEGEGLTSAIRISATGCARRPGAPCGCRPWPNASKTRVGA
jgi:arylsulfatase A-like enzyme